MKKTILLTGATGFLGSHIAERLVQEGFRVIILKRSYSDIWRIKHIVKKLICYDVDKVSLDLPFKDHRIDVVIHTATKYGKGKESISEVVEANLCFPIKLLETASNFGVESFLNTDTFFKVSYKYLNHYSLSKKQFVEWLKIFSKDLKVFNLKLEHLYGEKDDMTKFVPWIIISLLKGCDKIKLTEGRQKRDFIYVKDVVDVYFKILSLLDRFDKGFYEYEIGSGRSIEIREFIKLLKKLTDNDKTVLLFGALPYRENEIMDSKANINKIKKEIGWIPKTSLKEGLLKTINWYKESNGSK